MDTHLTDYSKRFLGFLEGEAPELHCLTRPAIDKEGRLTGFLFAELKAPNQRVAAPLSITTEDDEVTVGFDAFHKHFGSEDSAGSEEESFVKAVSLTRDIVAERVLVASWWLDGKWSGSQLIKAGVRAERPTYVPGNAALRVRSWSGLSDEGGTEKTN